MEKVQDRMNSAAAALRKSQHSKQSKGSMADESDSAFYQNSLDGDDQQQKLDLDDYIKTTEYKTPAPEHASNQFKTPNLSSLQEPEAVYKDHNQSQQHSQNISIDVMQDQRTRNLPALLNF